MNTFPEWWGGHAKRRLFERGHGRCGVADLPSLRFRRLEGALHGLVSRLAFVLLPAPVGRGGERGWGLQTLFRLSPNFEIPFFDPKDVKAVMGIVIQKTIEEQGWGVDYPLPFAGHSRFLRERGGPAGVCRMEEATGGGEAGGQSGVGTKRAGAP